jgi:hypothetical protein
VWEGRAGDCSPYPDWLAAFFFRSDFAILRVLALHTRVVEFDKLEHRSCGAHNNRSALRLHAVCSSFVLRCYANVVLPLKPPLRPSRFGRGVAQPG